MNGNLEGKPGSASCTSRIYEAAIKLQIVAMKSGTIGLNPRTSYEQQLNLFVFLSFDLADRGKKGQSSLVVEVLCRFLPRHLERYIYISRQKHRPHVSAALVEIQRYLTPGPKAP